MYLGQNSAELMNNVNGPDDLAFSCITIKRYHTTQLFKKTQLTVNFLK